MGFQLVMAEGQEAGREFSFEHGSVLIGRTAECEVILYDRGVSRRHARIFMRGQAYFIEDLGSANGTRVNGAEVRGETSLKEGDVVEVGPVVFDFSQSPDGPVAPAVADQSTRIVSLSEVSRQPAPATALAPPGAGPRELKDLRASTTRSMQAVRASSGSRTLARTTSADELSAVDKARLRRSGGSVGALKVFWAEASPRKRTLLLVGAGLLGVGCVGALAYGLFASGEAPSNQAPEPAVLTRQPVEDSFGLGAGVSYLRPDMKVFEFEYNAPVKAVVLVHFQAKDIAQGEVSISVNGAEVGQVPPDTLAVNEKSHSVLVPSEVLKKGETNQVIFDNVRNPPGEDSWRIWNVWVEINLLPELPPDDLLREANSTFKRAQLNFDRRDVGAVNRYSAWKDFRTTWLMLEAHPDPKPSLYVLARDKMNEAQQELDRTCAKLLLEAQGAYNQSQWDAARATLEHVKDYFPGFDQPCQWRAEQKRVEYGL